jgi:acyl carrier protein
MSSPDRSTFERIAAIIADTANVAPAKITPTAHVINDLGIDSLDFLDIVFAIDKEFGIKVPVEDWTEQVNAGKAPAEKFFILGPLAERIDELVQAKAA